MYNVDLTKMLDFPARLLLEVSQRRHFFAYSGNIESILVISLFVYLISNPMIKLASGEDSLHILRIIWASEQKEQIIQ